ncbi:hypothetical protein MZI42_14900 [Clostridioides difficile]|uniref:hypothetical protein n=1 Tax=Clostridioides difficile TaxID=1496 RepID=UPI001A28213E|nr:hypothetical protein [Clostridioides difficile]EGT3851367.1 hypothetical protein [Clostridioides difficile]EKG0757508.1 hypothetical protein [Clostridioides difficile]EKG0784929.1 hypothetical protein [Clostridioides difficile]EKS6761772.1 hypothetical protein [Clostridioides difficile]MBH7873787.1 hypothetical protein [Clostridioides difficile]
MSKDMIDECVHIMTAYITSLKEYYSFIETQIDDFIKKYGEDIVEYCLHRIMILLCECGLA